MAWNFANRPAGHRTVTATTYRNIYFDDEAVTLTITAGDADHYELRNYYGTIVQTGAVSGTSLALGVLPLGWYKLYLIRPASIGNPWLLAGGEVTFVVCRRDRKSTRLNSSH